MFDMRDVRQVSKSMQVAGSRAKRRDDLDMPATSGKGENRRTWVGQDGPTGGPSPRDSIEPDPATLPAVPFSLCERASARMRSKASRTQPGVRLVGDDRVGGVEPTLGELAASGIAASTAMPTWSPGRSSDA
jgi:hypothetical protein